MVKKFKNAIVPDDNHNPHHISLQDFINQTAPELLTPLAIMTGTTAVRFWQQTFQPPQPGEGKHWQNQCLRWPYAERLIYLSKEFLQLDNRCQHYIIKAAQAQIWWRGDDIQQFRRIVSAHLRYRNLSSADQQGYRKHLMQAARQIGRTANAD